MNLESYVPDDNELIKEIRELTGWGYSATRSFINHVDSLPTMLRRRGFILRRFADPEEGQEMIPQSVMEMRNHRSAERVRRIGNMTIERVEYEAQRVPDQPEYCTPSNNTALAVWTVYSQTRSAQSRQRSAELMRRQLG